MKRLTASGLHLAERCAAAFALPCDSPESTDAQAAGQGRHDYLDALAATRDRDAALATVPADAPHRATCEAIDFDALMEDTGGAEHDIETGLSHAWDPIADTAVALDVAAHRAYPDSDGIPGTLDWLVSGIGGARVIDFKGSEPVPPASENLQLALYALQVARARGLESIGVAIVYVHEDGSLHTDAAELDVFGLAAAAERIRGIWQRVQAARADVADGRPVDTATGEHCARCPAMSRCPAMVTLVREVALSVGSAPPDATGIDTGPVADKLAKLSDDEAGVVWVRVQLLDELVAAMKASLRARALVRGLPLPGGGTLVGQETARRSVDVDKALPVLRQRFGEQADAIVERSLSIGAVEKLARQLAPGRGQKKAVEAVVGELAAAGAVRESTFVQLRVRKPPKAADDAAA